MNIDRRVNTSVFPTPFPYTSDIKDVFDEVSKILINGGRSSLFPPHNIVQEKDEYVIELALAGYNRDEIKIELTKNILTVKAEKTEQSDRKYIYQGLSSKKFSKVFTLADDVEVKEASLNDGLLRIYLRTLEPEVIKIKEIEISKK